MAGLAVRLAAWAGACTMAGHPAITAIGRLGAGSSYQSAGQGKDHAEDDGQDQATTDGGPFHG